MSDEKFNRAMDDLRKCQRQLSLVVSEKAQITTERDAIYKEHREYVEQAHFRSQDQREIIDQLTAERDEALGKMGVLAHDLMVERDQARAEAAALREALAPFADWAISLGRNLDMPALLLEDFDRASAVLNNPGAGREYQERVRALEAVVQTVQDSKDLLERLISDLPSNPFRIALERIVDRAARVQNTEAGD